MEIRDNGSAAQERRRLDQLKAESSKDAQDALEQAQDGVRLASEGRIKAAEAQATRVRLTHKNATPRTDQVDLSSTARIFTGAGGEADPAAAEARAERVAELKAQFQAGTLNTPERAEQAATSLLARQ